MRRPVMQQTSRLFWRLCLLALLCLPPIASDAEDAQVALTCPICDTEYLILQIPQEVREAQERQNAEGVDGFYFLQPLITCPNCGMVSFEEFVRLLPKSPDREKFVTNIRKYLQEEDPEVKVGAPSYYRFAQIIEHMDPKALNNNPLQLFFLGFWSAAGAWEAEGREIFGVEHQPTAPKFIEICRNASLGKFETGIRQLASQEFIASHFPELILQATYMQADLYRKSGDFEGANEAVQRYEEFRADVPTDEPMVIADGMPLSSLDNMVERQKELVDARDADSRISMRDFMD